MFQEKGTPKNSLYFRKRNFLILRGRYIQNPNIFRTATIFRTLVYAEPEAYSEHCQTSTMEPVSFNIKKFLLFQKIIRYISGTELSSY